MRKNGFLVLGLMILHSALVAGDDRFGRNALFDAVQKNELNGLATHVNQLPGMAVQVLESGEKIPKYDISGMHLLHIFAIHAQSPNFFSLGLEIFESLGFDIDKVGRYGEESALHSVYLRKHCSQELRLQLILKLLDAGASPFIEMKDSSGESYNAFDLTLTKFLNRKRTPNPSIQAIRKLFTKNNRYILWHRLLSSYSLTDLSQEKIQNIIRYIFDKDDACALAAFLFWVRQPIIFADDLPAAPRCSALRDDADVLQQAKDLYREAVVLPEAIRHLRRSVPWVQSKNIVTLLRARESGSGRLRR